ncbi:hypothetical protein L210DRAFT_3533321 [Boletus edulis BED1]|uniref:Uncharacterized protein n=1 Tax=Boletus edulis BED1 TaxID=1328754 RepID=A0AAD4BZ16_BOLED|nr:hypothetical protein L210DRAFT_3533321 [Boletus edulis BED1]
MHLHKLWSRMVYFILAIIARRVYQMVQSWWIIDQIQHTLGEDSFSLGPGEHDVRQ